MGLLAATPGRRERALDDHDPEPLKSTVDGEITVHQQDSLALLLVDARVAVPVDVNDREVAAAGFARVLRVAPVAVARLVALSVQRAGIDSVGQVLTARDIDVRPAGEHRVRDVPELAEGAVGERRILEDVRAAGDGGGTRALHKRPQGSDAR